MQIAPLHLPLTAQPSPQDRGSSSRGQRSGLQVQDCLGILGHADVLLCTPCLVGTAPQSLSSTHHTETQPGDTDALATNLPEQIWGRNTPTALSGALRNPARSLTNNSHVEDSEPRAKFKYQHKPGPMGPRLSSFFVLPFAKWRQSFSSTCKGESVKCHEVLCCYEELHPLNIPAGSQGLFEP